jgi:hypothetical protein
MYWFSKHTPRGNQQIIDDAMRVFVLHKLQQSEFFIILVLLLEETRVLVLVIPNYTRKNLTTCQQDVFATDL